MKINNILTLILVTVLFTACSNNSVNNFTSTQIIKNLDADLYEILPENNGDILLYTDSAEITGEYLELASVEIEDIQSVANTENLMETLKEKAKEVGGNAVLILENTKSEDGLMYKQKIKAVAVFAFDLMPNANSLVSL